MPINIHPDLEAILRARAEAAGITVETYLEWIARGEQVAEDELEALALDGINSGRTLEAGAGFWKRNTAVLTNV